MGEICVEAALSLIDEGRGPTKAFADRDPNKKRIPILPIILVDIRLNHHFAFYIAITRILVI